MALLEDVLKFGDQDDWWLRGREIGLVLSWIWGGDR